MTTPTCATCRWWDFVDIESQGGFRYLLRVCKKVEGPLWDVATAHTETCGEHTPKGEG